MKKQIEGKGAENRRNDNYTRENPRNKKPKRAKAKNVKNVGMKGGRAHVRREMVKNRVHLVCATDVGRIFGPCCGVGSAGEGQVGRYHLSSSMRCNTSQWTPGSRFEGDSRQFIPSDNVVDSPFLSLFLRLFLSISHGRQHVFRWVRVVADHDYYVRMDDLSLNVSRKNKVCVLLHRMTLLYSIWDGKRGLN